MANTYFLYRSTDGLILNAIVWDGQEPYQPDEGLALFSANGSGAWIGWTYNAETGEFTAPPEPESEPEPSE
jgi:hypothetical protein